MDSVFRKSSKKLGQIEVQKRKKRELKYKLLTHFVVFALLTILMGKYWFADSTHLFLYAYGVVVTLVILTTFFVTFIFYKDPYELAIQNPRAFSETPLVSCMVAVKDEEDCIERCILSFIDQTYKNKEIIFVNDGSTDKTGKILDEYASMPRERERERE